MTPPPTDRARTAATGIVTGATGGMGAAVARRLAGRHPLILADLDPGRLEALRATLPGEHWLIAGDIARPETLESVIDALGGEPLGPVVHTAGLSPTMADAARILDVNLAGSARLAAALLPRAGAATVFVIIASMAAHSADFSAVAPILDDPLGEGVTRLAATLTPPAGYALSKHGVVRLVQREAKRWGERGARIVSVSPGLIDTGMGRAERDSAPIVQQLIDAQPVPRMGTVDEIADAVEFLLSDKARFITGTDLIVDGGSVAQQRSDPRIAAAIRSGG